MATGERTTEDARAKWWAAWWKADYSWDGLAKKPWPGWAVSADGQPVKRNGKAIPRGARAATLQDFWRAEASQLVPDPENPLRYWTRAHVPANWQSGLPAKSAWSDEELSEIEIALAAAIARLPANAFDLPSPPSRRGSSTPSMLQRLSAFSSQWPIPLDGAVLKVLPEVVLGRSYVYGRRTAFLYMLELPVDGSSIDLRSCLFEMGTYLDGAAGDAGDLRLAGSTFLSECSFESATMRTLYCSRTTFCEAVDFDQSRSRGRADFSLSSFHFGATFKSFRSTSAIFRRAEFAGDVDFENAEMKEVTFERASFMGTAAFRGLAVGPANFGRTTFSNDVDFTDFTSREANFQRSAFGSSVDFTSAKFGTVDFSSTNFSGSARFTDSHFARAMTFSDACFSGPSYFDKVTWPLELSDFEGAFREARFERYSDFQSASFIAFAAFDGASFKGEARFDPRAFGRDAGFKAALAMAKKNSGQAALGHGLRTLRHAAENVRDRISEQRFHRYELLTRRTVEQVGYDEKFLSMAYGSTSKYGYSLVTPLAWALGLWILGTIAYLLIAAGANLPLMDNVSLRFWAALHPATYEAAQFSARSILSLFSVWSLRPPEGDALTQTLEGGLLWGSPGTALGVRLISSGQSVLAGILLFLLGLAVRRRFQIA